MDRPTALVLGIVLSLSQSISTGEEVRQPGHDISFAIHGVGLCVSGIHLCASSEDQADKPSKMNSGNKIAEVKLSVSGKCDPTHCPLTISVENVSAFVFAQSEVGDAPLCKVQLIDNSGKRCVRTEDGLRLFGDKPPISVLTSNLVAIRKGEKKIWTFDLAQYFELKKGKWTVVFAIDLVCGKGKPLKSQFVHHLEINDFSFVVE